MFGRGIRLIQIGGINITIDYSWLLIFALVIYLLGAFNLPTLAPGFPRGWYFY